MSSPRLYDSSLSWQPYPWQAYDFDMAISWARLDMFSEVTLNFAAPGTKKTKDSGNWLHVIYARVRECGVSGTSPFQQIVILSYPALG
jgi:hypothetical protein